MNESLYKKWMEEELEDCQKALLYYGVIGLLEEFEDWLQRNNYINEDIVENKERIND